MLLGVDPEGVKKFFNSFALVIIFYRVERGSYQYSKHAIISTAFRWWTGDGMIFQGDPDSCVYPRINCCKWFSLSNWMRGYIHKGIRISCSLPDFF